MKITTILRRAGAVCFAAAMMLGISAPAEAAAAPTRDGQCGAGEFCYYYNSNLAGSISDMSYSLDNYGTDQSSCNHFIGAGNGKGKCVKNHAASAWNQTGATVRVYFNSGFVGDYQDFAPGERANLIPKLKNNNASHQFLGAPTPPDRTCNGGGNWINGDITVHYRNAADFKITYTPTLRTRTLGGGLLHVKIVNTSWEKILGCGIPGLTGDVERSIWQQLDCHVLFAAARPATGPTFDFESWRRPLADATGYVSSHCLNDQ